MLKSRRARERELRRREMLKAALELFSQRGYTNVTMDEIAEKAQFTKPTLYSYFKNKASLYSSIVLELGFSEIETRLRSSIRKDDEDPVSDLTRIRDLLQELCLGDLRRIILIYLGIARKEVSNDLSPDMLAEFKKRSADCLGLIELVIERGVQKGVFTSVKPALWTQSLWATCLGMAQISEAPLLAGKTNASIASMYQEITDSFLNPILVH